MTAGFVMPKGSSAKDIAAAKRAEEEARERDLWVIGRVDAREAVRTLRRRGFVVNRERGGKALVGNKLLTLEEVIAMAAREGGLAGMASPVRQVTETASGLKIGQSVALQPKKPVVAPTARPPAKAASPAPAAKPERKLSGAAATTAVRAAEHSADLGTKPRVVWLDLALLTVDKRYQREINDAGGAHVNRILKAFNWNCYQPIIVTEGADGTYAVIDGQHRLAAARKHPLIDSLPCYIIDAPDVASQAAIFVTVNSARRGLASTQKFFAALAAGDPHAVALDKLCKGAGVIILRSPPSSNLPPRSIVGALTLQRLLQRTGKAPLREALTLLAETHPEKTNAFRSPTIAALTRIAAGAGYSRDRLRAVLLRLDLDRLYIDAQADRATNGGTLETATERVLRARLGRKAAA